MDSLLIPTLGHALSVVHLSQPTLMRLLLPQLDLALVPFLAWIESRTSARATCSFIDGMGVGRGRKSSRLIFFWALSGASWFRRTFCVLKKYSKKLVSIPVGVIPTRLSGKATA